MFRSFVLLAICSVVTSQQPHQANDITDGISQFAYDFYKICADQTPDGNVLVSPYSMATTMSLLYQGATDRTLDEIQQALSLPDKAEAGRQFQQYTNAIQNGKGKSIFTVVNNIYLRNDDHLNPSFIDVAKNQYQSTVELVDFAQKERTAQKINKDVGKVTNGRINNLVQPDQFTADSRLFFVNAVYFKGAWALPFQQNLTQPADFHNIDSTTSSVPFMHAEKDFHYSFFRTLNASMLELKYHDSNFSLLILLPNVHTKLRDLEANMQHQSVADMVSRLVFDEVEVDIPRFNVQYEVKAKDALSRIGLGHMFSRNAKLANILTTSETLKVSDIVHKAVIEVNEKGSTAAAATGVGIVNYSFPPRFRADRPFLFYIYDHSTKTPIFSGRVTNIPSSAV